MVHKSPLYILKMAKQFISTSFSKGESHYLEKDGFFSCRFSVPKEHPFWEGVIWYRTLHSMQILVPLTNRFQEGPPIEIEVIRKDKGLILWSSYGEVNVPIDFANMDRWLTSLTIGKPALKLSWADRVKAGLPK